MSHDTQVKEAPERIWLIENNDPDATTETEILWSSAPSDAENDLNVEYVRADLVSAPLVAPDPRGNYTDGFRDGWKAHFDTVTAPASTVAPQQSRRSNHFDNAAIDKGTFPDHISSDSTAYYADGTILRPADAAAPASPAALRDEAESVDAERQAAAIVTVWRAIKDHDDRLLVRYIKQALLEWKPVATTTPSPTLAKAAREAAEEIREWIGLSGFVNGEGLNEVAAIIERCLAGGDKG